MLNWKRILALGALALAFFATAAQAQDPLPIYPDNYKVVLENDRVRVMEFTLRKGAKESFHSHPAHVSYILAGFRIRFTFPDGTTRIREAKAGDVLYSEALTHASENIGDTDARGLLIEMKPSMAAVNVTTEAAEWLTAVTFIKGLAGKQDELKKELLTLSAPTRAEPGNLRYDLYQSPENPTEFMRLEVWRNADALEIHKQTPHIKASFAKRESQGWSTQITRWFRVAEEVASASGSASNQSK